MYVDDQGLLAGDPRAVDDARDEAQQGLAALGNRRAALAESYGSSPVTDIQHGIEVAKLFNLVLRSDPRFRESEFRAFFTASEEPHKVSVQVFYFET
ncbi:hypothetical protein [Saccharopolyspora taberi]|uniref:Uncharacterized protein n=1 Tax=Saccharopolyspora taberi TaxID=60895 RepID=A0ABN3VKQ6_9PSEU